MNATGGAADAVAASFLRRDILNTVRSFAEEGKLHASPFLDLHAAVAAVLAVD